MKICVIAIFKAILNKKFLTKPKKRKENIQKRVKHGERNRNQGRV